MNETRDPYEALDSKDIADRAAACRDLSLEGRPEDLERLASVAGTDKSPGVRLSAAAAAADILSRYRVGPARAELTDDQREVFYAVFARVSPALNAGVFPMMACLDHARGRRMILGGLRDPQAGVRLGAAVGLMRLCSSISTLGDDALEASVVTLLSDSRHQPDALAQIARVCAAVGYTSASEAIRRLELSGIHAEVAAEALGVLDGAAHPLRGVWFSDGNDAGETNLHPPLAPMLAVFDGTTALIHDGTGWTAHARFEPRRRMFVRRVGEPEAAPAFQTDDRTFYLGTGPVIEQLVEADFTKSGRTTKAGTQAVEALSTALPDTAEGHYRLARVAMNAGMVDVATAALFSALEAKKTPAACWLALGDVLWEQEPSEAKAHYVTYTKRGRRRDDEEGMDRAKARS